MAMIPRRATLLSIALATIALPAALAFGDAGAQAAVLQSGADCGGPYTGVTGQPVTLRGAAGLRGALVFNWQFGDGESDIKNPATHVYTAPGVYTIDLRVVSSTLDSARCETTATIGGGQVAPRATPVVGAIGVGGPVVTPLEPMALRTAEPGWNLIAGPEGMAFTQSAGALYTFQAGDTAYESLPATAGVHGGFGYWAYFSAPTAIVVRGESASYAAIEAPAGQWVLIGNPSATETLTVRGADMVLLYDAARGTYVATDDLAPGQGAWALSVAGGAITVGE